MFTSEMTDRRPAARSVCWREGLLLAGFTVVFLAAWLVLARRAPLWYDEFHTEYAATRPSWGAFLDVHRLKIDHAPPLYGAVARALAPIVGTGPLGLRTPALLGALIALFGVYGFVRPWGGPTSGWIAIGVLLATPLFRYSYEARPYGLMLGFSALAAWCYQRATWPGRSTATLVGLGLSLALAVASHYYAVLVVAVLAVAELVRPRGGDGRWDRPVWIALAASGLPLVLQAPLMSHGESSGHPAPELLSVFQTYQWLLVWIPVPMVLALLVMVLMPTGWRSRPDAPEPPDQPQPPGSERVVAAGLALLPAAAVGLGFLMHAYYPRYAIPGVLGLAMLAAFAAQRVSRQVPGRVLALVLVGGFPVTVSQEYLQVRSIREYQRVSRLLEQSDPGDLPIVVPDHMIYPMLKAYCTPALARRMINVKSHNFVPRATPHEPKLPLDGFLADFKDFHPRNQPYLVLGAVDADFLKQVGGGSCRILATVRTFHRTRPIDLTLALVDPTDASRSGSRSDPGPAPK